MRTKTWISAITSLAFLAPTAMGDTLASGKYTVLSVTEGDLFTIDVEGKAVEVRLYGADAPEQGQGFYDEAKQYTEKQLKGKEITIEAVTQEETGRPVVVVRAGDTPVLHEDLVNQGLAWFDSNNVPDNATLKRLNAQAIVEGKGLFKDATALAPWDFRKSNNLPAVVYLKQLEAETPASKEEPKLLKAKGEGKDPQTAMKSASATAEPEQHMRINVGTPTLPPGIDTGDVDVMGLVGKHAPRIATDAGGNPLGLTADNISQIPMAAQLGFQDGDIVTSVNGNPIQSEMQALGLVEQLKGSKNLSLQILRNGQPTTLNIPIP